MNQTDDFLERIRQTEAKSVNKLSRFFTDFKIEPTSIYSNPKITRSFPAKKEFRPDTNFKIFTLAGMTLLLTMVCYKVARFEKQEIALAILGYTGIVILIGAIYSAIKDYFFNKTKNYLIQLAADGLRIDNTIYDWKDIYETAILTKYTWGPSQTKYLIIAFNDLETYEKFDLTHFVNAKYRGFSAVLSDHIESYKFLTND